MQNNSGSSDREVAVVTTGGTIGSVLSDSMRTVEGGTETISQRISEHCDDLGIELELVPAMNMLSENMEPPDWADVGESIQSVIDSGYENIIVTHGTDTMVYSANAFRNSLGDVPARTVFTGSFFGPDVADSDVEIALRSSLEACVDPSLPNDVYIGFRSPEADDRALLHRAVDTRPMNMDEMGFRSLFDATVGEYTWDSGWEWTNKASPTENNYIEGLGGVPMREAYADVIGEIQLAPAVPGQVLSGARSDAPEALIVDLYHSGTASLSDHSNGLRAYLREHGDETEILLVGMSSDIVSPPYESTATLIEEGAQLVKDVQPHVVYTALYVGLANGLSVEEILDRAPGEVARANDGA